MHLSAPLFHVRASFSPTMAFTWCASRCVVFAAKESIFEVTKEDFIRLTFILDFLSFCHPVVLIHIWVIVGDTEMAYHRFSSTI